jgi:hypothetical protein
VRGRALAALLLVACGDPPAPAEAPPPEAPPAQARPSTRSAEDRAADQAAGIDPDAPLPKWQPLGAPPAAAPAASVRLGARSWPISALFSSAEAAALRTQAPVGRHAGEVAVAVQRAVPGPLRVEPCAGPPLSLPVAGPDTYLLVQNSRGQAKLIDASGAAAPLCRDVCAVLPAEAAP